MCQVEVEGYEDAYDASSMLFMDFRRHHSGTWRGAAPRCAHTACAHTSVYRCSPLSVDVLRSIRASSVQSAASGVYEGLQACVHRFSAFSYAPLVLVSRRHVPAAVRAANSSAMLLSFPWLLLSSCAAGLSRHCSPCTAGASHGMTEGSPCGWNTGSYQGSTQWRERGCGGHSVRCHLSCMRCRSRQGVCSWRRHASWPNRRCPLQL